MKKPGAPTPGLRIGYARVSTAEQNLDLQHDALIKAGCATIYEETASSAAKIRPELDQALKALRPGDRLVVWRLDRLGRSLADLVAIITGLKARHIGFESLTEAIETNSAVGELVFHVFASLAQFERNLIRERTQAGLAAARARGRKGGRRPSLNAKQLHEIKALLRDPEVQVQNVAKLYKVSRGTIYNHLKAMQASESIKITDTDKHQKAAVHADD